jgi:hypothetical protein
MKSFFVGEGVGTAAPQTLCPAKWKYQIKTLQEDTI